MFSKLTRPWYLSVSDARRFGYPITVANSAKTSSLCSKSSKVKIISALELFTKTLSKLSQVPVLSGRLKLTILGSAAEEILKPVSSSSTLLREERSA